MAHSKASQQKVIAAENRVKALDLRKAGIAYKDIAKQLGVSQTVAYRYVTGELERTVKESGEKAEELRTLESERLDKIFQHGYHALLGGDLRGGDLCLKAMDRRARLHGLDAATRTEISGALTTSSEWIELRSVLLLTLGKFPDARQAVLEAIAPREAE